jgi:putative NIF3 family GTP cyclohydrolase 1 type 2
VKVRELHGYLLGLAPVPEDTVDRIVFGDPEAEVTKIATAWMPYLAACEEAVRRGANVIVTHEPAFYTHHDLRETSADWLSAPAPAKEQYLRAVEKKKSFLAEHGLAVIRCHDALDAAPGFGIPDAFGRLLGWGPSDIVAQKPFFRVYRARSAPAGRVASRLISSMKTIGQTGAAFYGDPKRPVRTVGIGTGCFSNPKDMADLGPDLVVAVSDVVRTWIETAFSIDTGTPLLVIDHGTSEEPGVRELSLKMRDDFPGLEVFHVRQGCQYRWVKSS